MSCEYRATHTNRKTSHKRTYFWALRLDAQDTQKHNYEKGRGSPSSESVATFHKNHTENNTITKKSIKTNQYSLALSVGINLGDRAQQRRVAQRLPLALEGHNRQALIAGPTNNSTNWQAGNNNRQQHKNN